MLVSIQTGNRSVLKDAAASFMAVSPFGNFDYDEKGKSRKAVNYNNNFPASMFINMPIAADSILIRFFSKLIK